jgi:hypothetical protein
MNLLVFAEDESTFLARAQRLAVEENVYLAMGMATVHSGERLPLENKLVLIDPAGRVIGSYLKNHPVQGWEESIMRVGDGRISVVATPVGKLAGAVRSVSTEIFRSSSVKPVKAQRIYSSSPPTNGRRSRRSIRRWRSFARLKTAFRWFGQRHPVCRLPWTRGDACCVFLTTSLRAIER